MDDTALHRLEHNLTVVVTAASVVYQDQGSLQSKGHGLHKVADPLNKSCAFHELPWSSRDSSAREVVIVQYGAGDTLIW